MRKSYQPIIIITVLLISALQVIFSPYRSWERTLEIKEGQIAERDIIAPVDFNVYKPRAVLQREQKEAALKVKPVYTISSDITYNALDNLSIIFRHFEEAAADEEPALIQKRLAGRGYELSLQSCLLLSDASLRRDIYDYLNEKLSEILEKGIFKGEDVYIAESSYEGKLLLPLTRQEAYQELLSGAKDKKERDLIAEISKSVLVSNIIPDPVQTEQEKQKARLSIPLVSGKILRNEVIIRKGERVRAEHLAALSSLEKVLGDMEAHNQTSRIILTSLGTVIALYLLLVIFNHFILSLQNFRGKSRQYYLLIILIFFTSILTIVLVNRLKMSVMILPLSFFIITVMRLFNRKSAFLFSIVQLFLLVILTRGQFMEPLLLTLSALSIMMVPNYNRINFRYFSLGLYMLIFMALFTISFGLIQLLSFSAIINRLFYGSISVILSAMFAMLFIPYLESSFNIITRQKLLELLNLENPLLKRLSLEIPGTYHHSLVVGNLAESAAEAIGANHLLARVGSYYHDIGKLNNPELYIENNPEASDIHDSLLPNQSAFAIKRHIAYGMELAEKSHLPQAVKDIIVQHHGTSAIKFFRSKAEATGLEFEEKEFHYSGPLPQTREAALVMIADIVESHSKSLTETSPEIMDKLIRNTIHQLIEEGQLNEAPLTMRELHKVMQAMKPILSGVYSTRIEYPQQNVKT